MKNHIPNIITLFNLLSGVLSIYAAMSGFLDLAAYLIFIAGVFDFFDGFAARLLNAKSDIGGELDSLADVISFGVAPGFILFQMLNLTNSHPINIMDDFSIIPFIAFIIPAFSALRLAKFNVDENQTDSFIGLPTPAMAIFVASLPLIKSNFQDINSIYFIILSNSYVLLSVAIVGSLLMVSRFPMFALKFKGAEWKENSTKYIFIIVSVALLILLKIVAIPVIILFLYSVFTGNITCG